MSTELDGDGFIKDNPSPVVPPPRIVAVPKFFDDCFSCDTAIRKMIDELAKPASVEIDGHDTLYRRLANALILILSIQGDFVP